MHSFFHRLGSIRITIPVLLLIAGASAVGTVLPRGGDRAVWESLLGAGGTRIAFALGLGDLYHSPWFAALLALLAANLVACMAARLPGMLSSLSGKAALGREPVLDLADNDAAFSGVRGALAGLGFRSRGSGENQVFARGAVSIPFILLTHGSLLVIMISSLAGSLAGFIATQRVYVGDATGTAYNWKSGADMALPFTVAVEEFSLVPNPVGLRLGILEVATGRKGKVITTHEGDVFRVPGLEGEVALERFDVDKKTFSATWKGPDGTTTGIRQGEEIGGTGLALVPVAFASWPERQVVAAVRLTVPGGLDRRGEIMVNHPMVARGIRVFLTDYGRDPFGLPYVGFQFVRDPGQAGVWAGCVLFLICVTGAVTTRLNCAVVVRQGGRIRVHLSSRGGDSGKTAAQLLERLAITAEKEGQPSVTGSGL